MPVVALPICLPREATACNVGRSRARERFLCKLVIGEGDSCLSKRLGSHGSEPIIGPIPLTGQRTRMYPNPQLEFCIFPAALKTAV